MEQSRATVVCMTPVKNEEWIIGRFLKAASLWADVIVVADQNSSDHTADICRRYPKVVLVQNRAENFNEKERQDLLIREARKVPGKKLLVALDADEFLTGNFRDNSEWEEMLTADPGTAFELEWPCIADDFRQYWMTEGASNLFAVMDDGCRHEGREMHSIRIPMSDKTRIRHMNSLKIMHFQYTDWNRMKCKNLWYQCYERIHHPEKSASSIYRMYHHMDVNRSMKEIPSAWFQAYQDAGITLERESLPAEDFWWSREIEDFLAKYGRDYFRYIDFPENKNRLLSYLRRTQFLWKYRYGRAFLRRFDQLMERISGAK